MWAPPHCHFKNETMLLYTDTTPLKKVFVFFFLFSFLLVFMNLWLTSSMARYSSYLIINISFPAKQILWESWLSLFCGFSLFEATMLFAELTYTLATEEAERIGVDHVARMTATGTGENSTGKERSLVMFSPWPQSVKLHKHRCEPVGQNSFSPEPTQAHSGPTINSLNHIQHYSAVSQHLPNHLCQRLSSTCAL